MTARVDPYRNFRFRVEIDGRLLATFSDVSGMDLDVSPTEYRQGAEGFTPRKRPGLTKYSNVTCKRGLVLSQELHQWCMRLTQGIVDRKSLTLITLDEAGRETAVFQVTNAYPVKYILSEFKGTGDEVLFETVEFAHEGLTRTR